MFHRKYIIYTLLSRSRGQFGNVSNALGQFFNQLLGYGCWNRYRLWTRTFWSATHHALIFKKPWNIIIICIYESQDKIWWKALRFVLDLRLIIIKNLPRMWFITWISWKPRCSLKLTRYSLRIIILFSAINIHLYFIFGAISELQQSVSVIIG